MHYIHCIGVLEFEEAIPFALLRLGIAWDAHIDNLTHALEVLLHRVMSDIIRQIAYTR